MATMKEIESLTTSYAKAREFLAAAVDDLEAKTRALRRRRLPGIRNLIGVAAEARGALEAAIADSADLFRKPKTRILHGVRVGFIKGKGKLKWSDPAMVVRLIRKHLPDQADVLIKVAEAPVRDALAGLDAATLKKIGVMVVDAGDLVTIKPAAGDLDKLVEALLKAAEDDEAEAAA